MTNDKSLFSQKIKNQAQYNTNNDTGSNGKIELKIFLFDDDIPGEPPQPGDLRPEDQKDTDTDYDDTGKY